MKQKEDRKIVLITRKTRLDDLIARFNTESQAKFYIEHLGDDYGDYKQEHDNYYAQLKESTLILSQLGRLHRIDRGFLPNYIFAKQDIIVVLGQDGLVANTLKYLEQQPVIGINPDPKRWDGVLLPFYVEDLEVIIPEVLQDKRNFREITMAKTTLNTGDIMYAINDFFIGPKSHTSARYIIKSHQQVEEQSSSGVIVSTGLGSTGWFKSLIAGSIGMTSKLTHSKKLKTEVLKNFTWESNFLYFTVREPFPSASSHANLVFGKISPNTPLIMTSRMADNGVIFSDGIEKDYLAFNSGTEAKIEVADKKGRLIQ